MEQVRKDLDAKEGTDVATGKRIIRRKVKRDDSSGYNVNQKFILSNKAHFALVDMSKSLKLSKHKTITLILENIKLTQVLNWAATQKLKGS